MLDAAASVAGLERHCNDAAALGELRAVFLETAGVAGRERVGEGAQPVKVRQRGRRRRGLGFGTARWITGWRRRVAIRNQYLIAHPLSHAQTNQTSCRHAHGPTPRTTLQETAT